MDDVFGACRSAGDCAVGVRMSHRDRPTVPAPGPSELMKDALDDLMRADEALRSARARLRAVVNADTAADNRMRRMIQQEDLL